MVNFFENFREIFSAPSDRGAEPHKRVRPDGAAPFSAPAERGTRTAAGGFALMGRLLSLHRKAGVRELPQAGSPLTGGFFSAPAERGARTALACSPLTGGEFSAEPQRGGFAVCGRRERAAPRGGDDAVPTAVGKKEGTTCGFPSSLDSYLSLASLIRRRFPIVVTAPKMGYGSRVILQRVFLRLFAVSQTAYCYTYGCNSTQGVA